MLRIALALALTLSTSASQAATPYWGWSLFGWEFSSADNASDADGGMMRLGVEFSPYLSLEGRVKGSFSDELTYVASGFIKPSLPLSERFRLYGLAGTSEAKIHPEWSTEGTIDGASLGAGAEFYVGDKAWLTLEYVDHARDDAYDAESVNFGARIEF